MLDVVLTYCAQEPEPEPKPKKKANTKAKADPAPKTVASSSSGGFLSGKKVLVTGTVPGYDRKKAQTLLEEAGADYQASLNKKVELVIIGTNAGPDKLAKIEDQGIETITWKEVADKLGLEAAVEKPAANVEVGDAPDSIDGKTIIISGTIEGQTRSSAQEALEAAGATFAKSLNKSVELVVLGKISIPRVFYRTV
jgi:NAD-dependent DNA ligase